MQKSKNKNDPLWREKIVVNIRCEAGSDVGITEEELEINKESKNCGKILSGTTYVFLSQKEKW